MLQECRDSTLHIAHAHAKADEAGNPLEYSSRSLLHQVACERVHNLRGSNLWASTESIADLEDRPLLPSFRYWYRNEEVYSSDSASTMPTTCFDRDRDEYAETGMQGGSTWRLKFPTFLLGTDEGHLPTCAEIKNRIDFELLCLRYPFQRLLESLAVIPIRILGLVIWSWLGVFGTYMLRVAYGETLDSTYYKPAERNAYDASGVGCKDGGTKGREHTVPFPIPPLIASSQYLNSEESACKGATFHMHQIDFLLSAGEPWINAKTVLKEHER
ncbi:uncharacterized protein FOMMEDRAFT_150723 [Fomitiporia mediterranea MF3/22]|uniref:uncharacterized protein n=1 Tax=Fomitiporia mediterranea (strain MF3/22) TaxID=694068 RepID=UPI0004408748|nr:uncharacterized protein FOMMEDRAFT_150723 [Fomitiporia mediterranea MF3/22]EJD08052.1 hypothetical protein FOMMEDRAFT_150723 [Fomitiporia mediterranea MF3/22]